MTHHTIPPNVENSDLGHLNWVGWLCYGLYLTVVFKIGMQGATAANLFVLSAPFALFGLISEGNKLWLYFRRGTYVFLVAYILVVSAWQTFIVAIVFFIAALLGYFLGVDAPVAASKANALYYLLACVGGFVSFADQRMVAGWKQNTDQLSFDLIPKAPMLHDDLPQTDWQTVAMQNGDLCQIAVMPLTLETLFRGYCIYHEIVDQEGQPTGFADLRVAAGGAEQIKATESRLGLDFSEGLKALYSVQNGGPVNTLCAESPEGWTFTIADFVPLEHLLTIHDAMGEDAPRIWPNPEETVAVCEGKGHVLTIDASTHEVLLVVSAREGWFDSEQSDLKVSLRWPDFPTFLAAQRRVVFPAAM